MAKDTAPANASASRLERLVRQARTILLDVGVQPEVDVQPSDRCWFLYISWDGNTPEASTLQVSSFTDSVQVLDPDGEDVTEGKWVTYLAHRAGGGGPHKALVSARRQHRQSAGT
ncbi:hypothetical protein ABZ299_15230 [Streptomyces sp. NPDC006184]|uniref:hypothetical protein n=1 Tax=Streptomyces sp. NPDC006184 TaxID=3155455 RepID=UPI0033B2DF5D